MKVSDYITNFISELGVDHVFFVTGAGIMHLTDSLARHPRLKGIPFHHEQSASMALDPYSRASENFGVAYFTTGPGVTNAITGLGGAWQDSVPCLFISGQVKRAHTTLDAGVEGLRQFGVQELNVMPIVGSLTKYHTTLNDATRVRYELEKAVYFAREGRPGPVWIDVPMDIQAALINPASLEGFVPPLKVDDADASDVAKVRTLLAGAKRPVIIAGHGVRLAKATDLLRELSLRHRIPVVTPYLGVDTMYGAHPYYLGTTGIKGVRAANFAMQTADLILSIGSSLHVSVVGYEPEKFAPKAKIVVVDIDLTAHRKKTIHIDYLIRADAGSFLRSLTKVLTYEAPVEWSARCNNWRSRYPVVDPSYQQTPEPINIYSFLDVISDASGDDDLYVVDTGSALFAGAQALRLRERQRLIFSSGMATMGFALPGAVGAQLGKKSPGRVIAITGDGSFQQNIQELSVIRKFNLPIVIIVLNNAGYLSIRQSQQSYFDSRYIGEGEESGLHFPDSLEIAKVYGIPAVRISNLAELSASLPTLLETPGPLLIEIMCPKQQKIAPTVASKIGADGKMTSTGLEDMAPFLAPEELAQILSDDP